MGKDHHFLLELEKITFSYHGKSRALDEIDFHLHYGEKTGLVGDNGSGKTTLLQLLVGIIRPDSGKMTIFGRKVEKESDFIAIREQIGLLFQNSDDQLFCPTVIEDVAFGPLNLGLSAQQARQRALETLEQLQLLELADRVTHQLSGGEKKLVALATLLSMKPKVLLLDEPTAGLDQGTKSRLAKILAELEVTYIMASHEFDFLSENTDAIYGMKSGRIEYHGKSSALHSHFHVHPAGEFPHAHEQ